MVHSSNMPLISVSRRVEDPKVTLVLMHGLGSDEQDMLGLAEMLDRRVEVVCLRAPYRYGPGYAWFDINWTPQGIQIDESQYWNAVEMVIGEIESLKVPRLVVGGFSQGAMMSTGTLIRRPDLSQAAVLLSGRGLSDEPIDYPGRVFQAHGAFDDVIAPEAAYVLKRSLTGLGDRYEFHEYEMGHWVSEEEIRDLNAWFGRLIG